MTMEKASIEVTDEDRRALLNLISNPRPQEKYVERCRDLLNRILDALDDPFITCDNCSGMKRASEWNIIPDAHGHCPICGAKQLSGSEKL